MSAPLSHPSTGRRRPEALRVGIQAGVTNFRGLQKEVNAAITVKVVDVEELFILRRMIQRLYIVKYTAVQQCTTSYSTALIDDHISQPCSVFDRLN